MYPRLFNSAKLVGFLFLLILIGCSANINSSDSEIVVIQGSSTIENNTGIFDFGEISINSSKSVMFTIKNQGSSVLKLTGDPVVEIVGLNADDFEPNLAMTSDNVEANFTTTFWLQFTPITMGIKSATIMIKNNDSDNNPFTFTVTGSGAAKPEINVKQEDTDILSGTGKYTFSDTMIGESSSKVIFTIENLGSKDLKLTNSTNLIEISGADNAMFLLDTTSTDDTITPGNSTTFGITFEPTSIGLKTAVILIVNNDDDETSYSFTVEGDGVTPEINLSQNNLDIPNTAGSFDFGWVTIGNSSEDVEFTIENNGNGILKLSGSPIISLSGTNASDFNLNSTTTDSEVSPGTSTSFYIVFSPSSVGQKTATVTIANNDLDENPYTFEITGTSTLKTLPFAIGWFGGGSNGWKTSNGTNPAEDYRSFKSQNGIFVDSAGNIYVADTYNNRVCKWDSSGNALGWIGGGSNGWKTGDAPSSSKNYRSFDTPLSVYVDSAGYIYVTDWGNNRVCKWSSSGNAIGWIGGGSNGWKTGNAPPANKDDYQSFDHPGMVFVTSSGYIYVTDPSNHRVCKWDSQGNAIGWIGGGSDGWKTSDGANENTDYQSFWNPMGLFVDSSDNIYIGDYYNHRVSKWSASGNAIGWIGGGSNGWKTSNAPANFGSDYRSFRHHRGLFVDKFGFIYVADAENHRVCKWSKSGDAIGWIGGGSDGWKTTSAPINATDYQSFNLPHDVLIDSQGQMLVSDTANNRICKWQN